MWAKKALCQEMSWMGTVKIVQLIGAKSIKFPTKSHVVMRICPPTVYEAGAQESQVQDQSLLAGLRPVCTT